MIVPNSQYLDHIGAAGRTVWLYRRDGQFLPIRDTEGRFIQPSDDSFREAFERIDRDWENLVAGYRAPKARDCIDDRT